MLALAKFLFALVVVISGAISAIAPIPGPQKAAVKLKKRRAVAILPAIQIQ